MSKQTELAQVADTITVNSGNVGIGTSSPVVPLTIYNNNSQILFHNSNTGTTTTDGFQIGMGGGSSTAAYIIQNENDSIFLLNRSASGSIIASTNNTERMRIDSGGNVSFGVSSPSDYYATDLVMAAPSEGGMTIVGGTTAENYVMFADGTAGADQYRGYIGYSHASNYLRFGSNGTERMRIDSAGRVTTPSQPAFRAYKTNGTISSNNVIVVYNNVELNIGSAYSSSTGRFTAPVAGNYMFNVQGICGVDGGTTVNGTLELQKNGVLLHRGHFNHDNRWENVSYSSVINMAVNDYVNLKFVQGVGSPELYGLDKYTSFSGYLLG